MTIWSFPDNTLLQKTASAIGKTQKTLCVRSCQHAASSVWHMTMMMVQQITSSHTSYHRWPAGEACKNGEFGTANHFTSRSAEGFS